MHARDESIQLTGANLPVRAAIALLGCGMFTTIGLFSIGIVLPQIAGAFPETGDAPLIAQVAGAISSFSFAIAAPLSGILIQRRGLRDTLVPALILFAIAGTAPALARNLWEIIVLRIILGIALAGIFTAGLTGIALMSEAVRARLFGWYAVVGGVTAMVVFPVVGVLAGYGWRAAFLVNLAALAILPFASGIPREMGRTMRRADAAAPTRGRPFLDGPMLGLLALSGFAGMAMFIGPMFTPIYLSGLGVTDPRLIAAPITAASVAAVAASASYGWLHRRLGVAGITALTMALIGGALLLSGLTTSILPIGLGVVLAAVGVAAFAPNVSAAAVELSAGRNQATVLGAANGALFGAQVLFPFIAEPISRSAGPGAVFLAFGSCALLIGAGHGLMRRRTQPRSPH